MEQGDDAAGFLGVILDHNNKTGLLDMLQYGLIKRIFEALGLYDDIVTKHHTSS